MRNPLAAFVLLLLAGCARGGIAPDQEPLCGPRPTDEQAQKSVQIYLQQSGLNDPSGAKIRQVRVVKRAAWYNGVVNGGGYTYGWLIDFELNARNAYGAYIGFKPREFLRSADGLNH